MGEKESRRTPVALTIQDPQTPHYCCGLSQSLPLRIPKSPRTWTLAARFPEPIPLGPSETIQPYSQKEYILPWVPRRMHILYLIHLELASPHFFGASTRLDTAVHPTEPVKPCPINLTEPDNQWKLLNLSSRTDKGTAC